MPVAVITHVKKKLSCVHVTCAFRPCNLILLQLTVDSYCIYIGPTVVQAMTELLTHTAAITHDGTNQSILAVITLSRSA